MELLQSVACFFAGAFLANVVPHFVAGIQGNRFPTPFSKPRGIGLSSPTLNVAWALVNGIVGVVLFRRGNIASGELACIIPFFSGISVLSIALSKRFSKKHA
jgi:hypothetical protein